MKIEKLSLSNVKNVLSRAELKSIMAGSGSGGGGGGGGFPPIGTGSGGCWVEHSSCSPRDVGYCCSGLTCRDSGGGGRCSH
ncbi:hypothetical protein [Pedobacter antarcticus]|uniref:hypothetical protein n=1 Tax=Pedobacter antarcticus TaxID=34086 RepID=UPI001C56980C|nr:hypothetical protein [Pedobacter antarcticus]